MAEYVDNAAAENRRLVMLEGMTQGWVMPGI
ncbi:hypothetical protein JOE33_002807 [Pseudomonas sp. PvP027]|nr:hypothetical protein [Pseudomonas sp. PvP027]